MSGVSGGASSRAPRRRRGGGGGRRRRPRACRTTTTRTPTLLPWEGPRQAGIVTERTPYGMVAAFDVVTDDLPRLFRDLTGADRRAHPGLARPARPDLTNASLPPSDTGELGFDDRDDGRLTITIALGASLFDDRFGLARQAARRRCSRMPSFPGDNLDPDRSHGDLLVLVQSDHAMVTHHAVRDVMRRTKGRLEGRWAQSCFQRFARGQPVDAQAPERGRRARPARLPRRLAEHRRRPRGADLHRRGGARLGARRHLPGGAPDPAEARALGPALAHRPGATRSAARRCPARRSRAGARRRRRRSTSGRRSTPTSAWPTRARPGDERHRFLRRAVRVHQRLRRVRPARLRLGLPGLLPRPRAPVRGRPSGARTARTSTSTWSPSAAGTSSARPAWRARTTTWPGGWSG